MNEKTISDARVLFLRLMDKNFDLLKLGSEVTRASPASRLDRMPMGRGVGNLLETINGAFVLLRPSEGHTSRKRSNKNFRSDLRAYELCARPPSGAR
jgi:hypothetical protein